MDESRTSKQKLFGDIQSFQHPAHFHLLFSVWKSVFAARCNMYIVHLALLINSGILIG